MMCVCVSVCGEYACIRSEEERRRESGVLGCQVVLSRLMCSTPGSCWLVLACCGWVCCCPVPSLLTSHTQG